MGLDSSVTLKSKRELTSEFPAWVSITRNTHITDHEFPYLYDISYFRKAWAVHDLMVFLGVPNCDEAEGDYKMLEGYREGLIDFLRNPEDFDDRSQVFTMKTYMGNIAQSILNCSWAIKYLKEHLDVVVEFSDSY